VVDEGILQQFVKSSKTIVKSIVQLAVKCKRLSAYCHEERLESIQTLQSRDSTIFLFVAFVGGIKNNPELKTFITKARGTRRKAKKINYGLRTFRLQPAL